ncbi:MAG: hypothetical protein ACOC5T_00885 [Elusimicrobiota bacterium]
MQRKKCNNGQRLKYDFVRKFFEENGCKLLSKEYKNARAYLEYICECGNKSKITFDSFRRGHRCKKCATRKKALKQSLNYEYVKEFIKNKNCVLLSKKYKNAKQKLKIQCQCDLIFYRCFNNFKSKKQYICPKCSLRKRSGSNHYEWNSDREHVILTKQVREKSYKMIKNILKLSGKIKKDKTDIILGYKTSDLVHHIQNHPNWENINKNSWHIDHIFPIKAFLDHGITDLKIINCLDNLQPLNAKDNLIKNDKYDLVLFRKWLRKRNILIHE